MTQQYSYFQSLPPFYPFDSSNSTKIAPLGQNEMRITFMGSGFPPPRRAQQMMSIFVEVGWDRHQMPLDQFVFDCGTGVVANYGAMNVGFGRMDKVFIAHLHGDHMSDLTQSTASDPRQTASLPCTSGDPKGPTSFILILVVKFGQNIRTGLQIIAWRFDKPCRWHTESFSFQTTSYPTYPALSTIASNWGLPYVPSPVVDTDINGNPIHDPDNDAYAMIPIELDWTKSERPVRQCRL